MKPLLRWVLDSVLPPSCLLCAEPVEADGQFCLSCFNKVNFITPPFCACCGVPFSFVQPGEGGQYCTQCLESPSAFHAARSALRYDKAARQLILPLKYSDKTETIRGLARLMQRAGHDILATATVMMPVPLYPSRLRQRRYNQAALLAKALAKLTSLPVQLDSLQRSRATKALEGLSAKARHEELEGAFHLRQGAVVRGQHVVLVDDVMTTGATAHYCALVLREAGAAQVDVLTIARVEDPRQLC